MGHEVGHSTEPGTEHPVPQQDNIYFSTFPTSIEILYVFLLLGLLIGSDTEVPAETAYFIFVYIFILFSSISLLVLHKDEVEDTVEYSIDEVRESQIENEEVCNCSHPLVPCKQHVNKMSGRLIF